jgi:DNA-binding SARP family transcriptional activator
MTPCAALPPLPLSPFAHATFVDDAAQIAPTLRQWLHGVRQLERVLVVAGPQSPLVGVTASARRPIDVQLETPHALGLVSKPFSLSRFEQAVLERVAHWLPPSQRPCGLIIDMDWLLLSPAAAANASVWGGCAQRLAQALDAAVLCVYHRRYMPERLLLAGLHAHRAVVSLAGVHANPYWLPDDIAGGTCARQRLDHWLSTLHPAWASAAPRPHDPDQIHAPAHAPAHTPAHAQGSLLRLRTAHDDPLTSEPDTATRPAPPDATRWKVRCFGQLRVYLADGVRIRWDGAAGAARKARALFAFLLLRGNRGATADELIEWLWPTASTPRLATNRLHHTINALRRSLLPEAPAIKAKQHPYLVLEEGRYRLRPPPNTWVDVEDFEQLCRQGATLLREGALNEALLCLETALKLYSGDLFEDLPSELTDDRDNDWCWSRRYWFKDMVFKIHRDCATIHRLQGQHLQAISHCQQALQRDPACDLAHAELMRVYAAQGRADALARQYRLYRLAVTASGHLTPEAIRTALHAMSQLHAELLATAQAPLSVSLPKAEKIHPQ